VRVRGGDGSVFTLKRKVALNRFLGGAASGLFCATLPGRQPAHFHFADFLELPAHLTEAYKSQ
jgi:hypothetical protein